jgi:predicted acetyltransferase
MAELLLRELRPEDRESFLAAVEEFRRTDPDWDFAFHFDPEGDFDAYVQRLQRWQLGEDMPRPFVPNSYLVGVVGATVVGRLSFRHELNGFLRREGGHMGYGVVASQRRRGYATSMLRQALPLARARGLTRVLVTCDDDNEPSRRTIERCGGVLEDILETPDGPPKRRYWIEL